ncbi:MAG: EF-hand domain-containing protein [Methylophilaceae bacterium]
MKSIHSNKSINTMLTSVAGLLFLAVNTVAIADSKEAVKAEVKDPKAITKVVAEAPKNTGFKALDGNSDGKISLKEAVKDPVLAEKFNATDANHDGAITAEEYAMYTSKTEKPTAVN